MKEQPNYPAQVADLITAAMDNLGTGLTREAREEREEYLARATAKLAAAQATATLAHAHETRTLALATLAGLEPVKVEQAGPLAQEALIAAAVALGLVEDPAQGEADARQAEILRNFLKEFPEGKDPADADMGDLK